MKPVIGILARRGWWLALVLALVSPVALDPSEAGAGEIPSVEERRVLMELKKEKERLLEWEKKLNAKEIELKTLAAEVDKKIQKLSEERKFLEVALAKRAQLGTAKTLELSKIYEKMDPAEAVPILEALDEDLVIAILSGMKSKAAGRLLAGMEEKKAVRLSTSYSLRQRR